MGLPLYVAALPATTGQAWRRLSPLPKVRSLIYRGITLASPDVVDKRRVQSFDMVEQPGSKIRLKICRMKAVVGDKLRYLGQFGDQGVVKWTLESGQT